MEIFYLLVYGAAGIGVVYLASVILELIADWRKMKAAIADVALNQPNESAKYDIHRSKRRSAGTPQFSPNDYVESRSEIVPEAETTVEKPFWENYDALQAEKKRIEIGESTAPDVDALDYARDVAQAIADLEARRR